MDGLGVCDSGFTWRFGICTLTQGPTVNVTYSGEVSFGQTGGGTNYWTEPLAGSEPYTGAALIDNAPTASEMVALDAVNSGGNTITFDKAVRDPILAIVSQGRPGQGVAYSFDTAVTFLNGGWGYWNQVTGTAGTHTLVGNVLTGEEFHGVIQFKGEITSISFTNSPSENWHGITIGIPEDSVVPSPTSAVGLIGMAAMGLIVGMRRRRRRT